MKNKIFFIMFIILCIAQIVILSNLVYKGRKADKIVYLKCRLYDPYDILKGRYVQLSFDFDRFDIKEYQYFKNHPDVKSLEGKVVFCLLDEKEFSVIDIVDKKPAKDKIFIKANVRSIYSETVYLNFNFDKYYMQEDLAIKAEEVLRALSSSDDNLILVLSVDENGGSKIIDLKVNDKSIEDLILIEENL